ncbi:MAG: DUF4423 domain-containing protein [Bdellovibrionales bacterium]|nr:DUF4423 domain-containing protein [Bdellovibrionales bacterium]
MENVNKYHNYREFLNDHVAEMKRRHRGWSLNRWQRQLGLKSSGTLSMVLSGQRQLGEKLTQSLIRYFKFNQEQARFFERLVMLQKRQEDPKLRLFLTAHKPANDPEGELKPTHSQVEQVQRLLLDRFTHILREILSLRDFVPNPEWIARRLRRGPTAEVVREHLRQLQDAKLVSQSGENSWQAVPTALQLPQPDAALLAQFHRQVLEDSARCLGEVPEAERAFHVSYLNVRRDQLPLAKKMLRQFQVEFSRLFAEPPGDEVYQLSLQFVPITQGPQDSSSEAVPH